MEALPNYQPRKAPTQDRAKKRVSAIVEAAERILMTEGFEKMSTNQIAREAGVSIGSVYQYFPNKESIIVSLCERESARILKTLSAHLSQLEYMDIETILPHYISGLFDAHSVNPALFHALRSHASHILHPLMKVYTDSAVQMLMAQLKKQIPSISEERLPIVSFILVTTVNEVVHGAFLYESDLDPNVVAGELTTMVKSYLRLGDSN